MKKSTRTEKPGISACILARNEESRIEETLQSLQGWTRQIIVIDNESEDRTVEIARRYTDCILTAPRARNFDAARNLAIDVAISDWILYVDADERVPPPLVPLLLQLIEERGHEFEALCIPFKHYFCGRWIRNRLWCPGYTRPQLLKKGKFHYNARLHSGVHVDGRTISFPADNPDLAIVHYSYENLTHYLTKLNNYTDGEAESLCADGASHSWQSMLAHFVNDWQLYYEQGEAQRDGMHGFVLSFMGGLYRFASRAKAWDARQQAGQADPQEPIPANLPEMLEFMARVAREGAEPWLRLPHSVPAEGANGMASGPPAAVEMPGVSSGASTCRSQIAPVPLLWHAPLFDGSGYADEARNFFLALSEAGEPISVAPNTWNDEDAGIHEDVRALIHARTVPVETPTEIFISQTTPALVRRSPTAKFTVARTMFETDGLPEGWASMLNAVDRVWVPSTFNAETFAHAGVDPGKIAVIPGCIDPSPFAADIEPWPLPTASSAVADMTDRVPAGGASPSGSRPYRFLSVFDWSLHKGWDVLVEAFAAEFGGDAQVELVLKVWSSLSYTPERIREQVDEHLRGRLGKSLEEFPNIHLWYDRLPVEAMPRVYRAADAFVLPTRGEGWCRPLMEAMASGLPTIATAWSGLTAFHNARVGYPLKSSMAAVSEDGAREIPIYRGQQWADPDKTDLRRLLRHLVRNPQAARRKGETARRQIARHFSRSAVAPLLQAELARCRELAAEKPWPPLAASPAPTPRHNAVLVQHATGGHEKLLELTRESHARYAAAHGMDYLCLSGSQQQQRKPEWDKILVLLDVLKRGNYEHIFWLDADTWIVEPRQDLRQALPPGKWLGMVLHGSPPQFNNGVMYLRNTPACRAFFEAVWQQWPVENAWEDNAAVIEVLQSDSRWRDGIAVLDNAWNSTLKVNESPLPVVLAWHGYGNLASRYVSMQSTIQALAPAPIPSAPARPHPPAESTKGMPPPHPERPPNRVLPRDPASVVDLRAPHGRPLRVRWEGPIFMLSSLARVNREYCLGLLNRGDVELSVVSRTPEGATDYATGDPRFAPLLACHNRTLSGPPDVTIRHFFPPDWSRPTSGKLIVIQPWEFGHLPLEWVRGANENADEVWAYSRFVRSVYVRSGVSAEKVRVMPLGVRADVFTPDGPRFPLPTTAELRILYLGGTISRKGADLLLESYRTTFHREDSVCLVVKDMGRDTFYRGQDHGAAFLAAQADRSGPEVVYLDREMSDEELAALIRTCDCVALPYRGEGFALAPLEGMACGIPAIVTAGGSTDDYLDDETALRVPFRRRYLGSPYAGALECAGDPWNLEPDPRALADALRWVRDHPEETRERGRVSRERVLNGWSWQDAQGLAAEALLQLVAPLSSAPTPVEARVENSRPLLPEPHPTPKAVSKGRRTASRSRNPQDELSLCMIVRDEEPRIGACLESIRPFVDEMIVVDTGSRDRTREIATAGGARVLEFSWVDDFAAARNCSLEHAQGRWIFWMDADDTISPECGALIRELIRSRPQRDAAFCGRVMIPPAPGEFGGTVAEHVKLFPNLPNLRFEHRIHEQVIPSLRRAGLEILPSELYVTHANYDRSPEGQRKKRLRDFRLLRLDLVDRPDHPFVLYNLGMTYLYATDEYEVAAHYLRRALARSHPRDSIVQPAYAMLTKAYCKQLEWHTALEAAEAGRTHHPDDAELLFLAGQLYQRFQRFDEARAALERLVDGPEPSGYRNGDVGLRTYKGKHELALLFQRLGDGRHCAEVLLEIVAAHPEYLPARVDLVETMASLGRTRDAEQLLDQIPDHPALADRLEQLRAQIAKGMRSARLQ